MRAGPAPRRVLLLAAALIAAAPVAALPAPVLEYEIVTRGIENFRIGSTERRFGPLEFLHGLEMTSRGRHFGGLSSFRYLTPGRDFIGVTDTGFWFFGTVERDAEGLATGIADLRMQAMVDGRGRIIGEKHLVDAEGLSVHDGIATVSFERAHRISEFRIEPGDMRAPIRDLDFLVPARELRRNRGFETVARAPDDGALQGARVAVTEMSLDRNGDIFAAVLEGPMKGVFTVARHDDFAVTDGVFLPGGDLLLLERSFSLAIGVGMRLRRIAADTIGPGLRADGPVLMEANMGFQIDNMEGIDVWEREDGATIVSIVSDDNHSIFQRNLLLEFRLVE